MKDFLKYLLDNIVDTPSAVEVKEQTLSDGMVNLQVRVDPLDMGKVIGKSGRIIKALRDLVRILAVKKNLRVNVSLQEE